MEQKKVVKKVESKDSFIDKLKRNWKNILLILLIIFSFSKCTSSCSRGRQIDRLNYQIEQRDSIITANGIELDKLSIRLNDAQTNIESYKGIATTNQQELVDKVSELTDENTKLTKENTRLSNENSNLKTKVKQLEKELLDAYD